MIMMVMVMVMVMMMMMMMMMMMIALKGAMRDFYSLLTAPRTFSNTYTKVALAQSYANNLQHIERL